MISPHYLLLVLTALIGLASHANAELSTRADADNLVKKLADGQGPLKVLADAQANVSNTAAKNVLASAKVCLERAKRVAKANLDLGTNYSVQADKSKAETISTAANGLVQTAIDVCVMITNVGINADMAAKAKDNYRKEKDAAIKSQLATEISATATKVRADVQKATDTVPKLAEKLNIMGTQFSSLTDKNNNEMNALMQSADPTDLQIIVNQITEADTVALAEAESQAYKNEYRSGAACFKITAGMTTVLATVAFFVLNCGTL